MSEKKERTDKKKKVSILVKPKPKPKPTGVSGDRRDRLRGRR